ncbi:MAG: VWA domain-containing protein [Polyangiaceae bacterium]
MRSRLLVSFGFATSLLVLGCGAGGKSSGTGGDGGSGAFNSGGGTTGGSGTGATTSMGGTTSAGGTTSMGGATTTSVTTSTECPAGTADCNMNPQDGCETITASDPNNCGACMNVCQGAGGLNPTCSLGVCGVECPIGKGNCDGNAQNGCESDLTEDSKNCGACGFDCMGAACVSGTCACATESKTANPVPLDLFIMLDQSGSMDEALASGGTKWTATTTALKGFFGDPANAALGVGLQYFPLVDGGAACNAFCTVDADCGGAACGPCLFGFCLGGGAGGGDSCNVADYAMADVEIAALNATQVNKLNTSINAHSPTTNTPTSAALQGAINHSKAWAQAHPTHKVAVVFATDGEPTECDPMDIPSIAAIAQAGVNGNPSIPTFVIGVGPSLDNMNAIAAGGGTGQAFLVDTGGNVVQQFEAALASIQQSALGCEYTIPVPQMGMVDYGKVNVQYTPGGGGAPQVIANVANAAACDPQLGGWYYDNNAMPTKIILCDKQCAQVSADQTGKVDILLGCATQHI